MATIDLGKIKFNWRGTYAGGTAYVPDDVVYYKFENEYPHHGTGAWVNF